MRDTKPLLLAVQLAELFCRCLKFYPLEQQDFRSPFYRTDYEEGSPLFSAQHSQSGARIRIFLRFDQYSCWQQITGDAQTELVLGTADATSPKLRKDIHGYLADCADTVALLAQQRDDLITDTFMYQLHEFGQFRFDYGLELLKALQLRPFGSYSDLNWFIQSVDAHFAWHNDPMDRFYIRQPKAQQQWKEILRPQLQRLIQQ